MKTILAFSASFSLALAPAFGTTKAPRPETQKAESGVASWYGGSFVGGKTASGETYRAGDKTAAHRSLPFNSLVRVTDERTGRSTTVRINNRGPYVKGRVIDLSSAAATELGITRRGVARVKLEIVPGFRTEGPITFRTWHKPLVMNAN